jgi:hypothetical protein
MGLLGMGYVKLKCRLKKKILTPLKSINFTKTSIFQTSLVIPLNDLYQVNTTKFYL